MVTADRAHGSLKFINLWPTNSVLGLCWAPCTSALRILTSLSLVPNPFPGLWAGLKPIQTKNSRPYGLTGGCRRPEASVLGALSHHYLAFVRTFSSNLQVWNGFSWVSSSHTSEFSRASPRWHCSPCGTCPRTQERPWFRNIQMRLSYFNRLMNAWFVRLYSWGKFVPQD